MSKLPNHYETLNISNKASIVEINAAYNILTKMFGADADMAQELDQAYRVLSDEEVRAAYDRRMVEEMNMRASRSEPVAIMPDLPALPVVPEAEINSAQNLAELIALKQRQRESLKKMNNSFSSRVAGIAIAIAVASVIGLALNSPSKTASRLKFMKADEILKPTYVRSETAPNGQAYPTETAYISGYEVLNNTGASSLQVINSKNENDVYLKVLSLDGEKPVAVRHVFIKGKTDFKIENLNPGKYEVQYLDLVAGLAGRSEVFSVSETKTETGSTFSRMSVTLQTATNGILPVEDVSVDAFNSVASL